MGNIFYKNQNNRNRKITYEYEETKNDISIIKLHIPKGKNLDLTEMIYSIKESKNKIKQIFKLDKIKYICNSWLLSNQVYNILDKNSNIYFFHNLFDGQDGKDCVNDIMNFVYRTNNCNNYKELPESTILQKRIKEKLLNNQKFYLEVGVLKEEIYLNR